MVIAIGNVYSRILDCTPLEYMHFRECLTFDTPNYWFSEAYKRGVWDGKKRFFKDKSFPTGLLFLVREAIPDLCIKQARDSTWYDLDPNILKTKKMTGKFAYQFDSLKAIFEYKRGILDNATGAGKTNTCAAFFAHLRRPSLFLVHTKELLEQAYEVFRTETKLPVGKFGAGEDSRLLLTVGMVQTISRRLKDNSTLGWLRRLEAIVADECHLASAKSYTDILQQCTNAQYRIGISGTPLDRSKLDNLQLLAYFGPVIHSIRNEVLIASGVNAVPLVEMIKFDHKSYPKKEVKYAEVYTEYIVRNEKRNNLAVTEAINAIQGSNKVLVLVHRQEHGFLLQKLFEQRGIIVSFCYGESSKEERAREFDAIKNGKSQVLIASKIAEVGLDIPQLSAMIRASGGKSTVSTLQAIGRVLRNPWSKGTTVKYIDFFDDDGIDSQGKPNWLRDHSLQRKRDYGKEKFSVVVRGV